MQGVLCCESVIKKKIIILWENVLLQPKVCWHEVSVLTTNSKIPSDSAGYLLATVTLMVPLAGDFWISVSHSKLREDKETRKSIKVNWNQWK